MLFDFSMPLTCPNEAEKCCSMEECAYFQWKEESEYLRWKRKLMKIYLDGAEIITSREEWENPDREIKRR